MNTHESAERAIPSAQRLEKSILSCLIQEEHVEGEETLTPEHFHHPINARLYSLITSKCRPIDLTALGQELLNSGELDNLGGASYITEIYTYATTTVHFKGHVKELHMFKARRYAIRAALNLLENAYDLTDSESFLEAAGKPMTDIADIASAAYKSRNKNTILKELMEDIEARIRGEKTSMGWSTGIAEIDEAIRGLHPKRLCIVSGYPTSGKTVLAVQMLWNAAMAKIPSLFISLEMPDKSIAERNLVIASNMPAMALTEPQKYAEANNNARPTKEHLTAIRKGSTNLRDYPMYFEDPPSQRMSQIVAMIRRNVRKHGVRLVAVDYLQLVKGNAKSWSKENEIAEISHTFQALAKELDISILLLSQQNKDGATKYAEAIAEDADAILSIVQDRNTESDDFGKHLGIGVRKDRHYGNTGDFLPVVLDKTMLKFTNVKII